MKKITNKITSGVTNKQQTNNKQITTTEEIKNINNINNINNAEKIVKCYEENIGILTPASADLLFTYLEDFKDDIIIEAIKTASIQNKRSTKYICGILNSWKNKGYKNISDIQEEKDNKNMLNDKNCTHNFENELAQYGDLSALYDN